MTTPERDAGAPLFVAGAFRALELDAKDVPRLQQFFDLNPEYFFAVSGQPANPDDASVEMHGALPAGWPYTRKWIIGFVDEAGVLIGLANVVSDLLARGVWHIGLFIVATRLHGCGAARSLYERLERWMLDQGAQWLRLGVVQGNARAERFWEKCGFIDVRTRGGMQMGLRVNTLRVMAKPLAGGTVSEYLALVARDRPESS